MGHNQHQCKNDNAKRSHYDKMLKLVTAYRALVKEQGSLRIASSSKGYREKAREKNKIVTNVITLDSDGEEIEGSVPDKAEKPTAAASPNLTTANTMNNSMDVSTILVIDMSGDE